jgi:predicted DCC family thiol-disulfide oxidoreductase YuxK
VEVTEMSPRVPEPPEKESTLPSALPESTRLTVFYDERCPFCLRCRDWLLVQPCFVKVELVPAGSAAARERYGTVPWLGKELVVVDDRGRTWVGPAAFLVCLWATVRYRAWSYRLSKPALAPHVAQFFMFVSTRRDRWGAWARRRNSDCSYCDEMRLRWNP